MSAIRIEDLIAYLQNGGKDVQALNSQYKEHVQHVQTPSPRRMEQSIFTNIVKMTNEMNKAEQMKQANTRLFDQVKQAFKDIHEWTEEEDGDGLLYEEATIDLNAEEHPHVNCYTVCIKHYEDEQRFEVDTDIHMNNDYDDHFYDESSYYYDGTFQSGMDQVQSALVKQLTALIDSSDAFMIAVAKVAPIIRQEIDRLLTHVNRLAYCPERPPMPTIDGVTRVGSICYRKDTLRGWMFDPFLEKNPTITDDHIRQVLNEKQYKNVVSTI